VKAPGKMPLWVALYDLADLAEGEARIVLEPDAAQRAAIAAWTGLAGLEALTVRVLLVSLGEGHYRYEGSLAANVVQQCVVTLEPVRNTIARDFQRRYRVVGRTRAPKGAAMPAADDGEDGEAPEEVRGRKLDLAAPVVEELSLGIDPYPRAEGAVFEASGEPGTRADNPFAVLKSLKKGR